MKKFWGVVAVALAAVVLVVASVLSTASPVETQEFSASPYGAYGIEMANSNPTSLGFSPSLYLNSPQQQHFYPSVAMQPRRQRMSVAQRKKMLEARDENKMIGEEQHQADIATEAIRKDIEEAKLEAVRRQKQERKDGYFDPHAARESSSYGAKGAAAAKKNLYAAVYSPEAFRSAMRKKLAAERLQTQKELDQTFHQLARAVGAVPLRPRQQRLSPDDFFRDRHARLMSRRRLNNDGAFSSMLSMTDDNSQPSSNGNEQSQVEDPTARHYNLVSDAVTNFYGHNPNSNDNNNNNNKNNYHDDNHDDFSSPRSAYRHRRDAKQSSAFSSAQNSDSQQSSSYSSSANSPAEETIAEASSMPNSEDVHEMAADDVGNEIGPVTDPSPGDNVFAAYHHNARLRLVPNGQLLAQVAETANERRKKSLAALARETGGESADMRSQWHAFTQDLGMEPPRANVDSRAARRVDSFIDQDLM